MVITNIPFIIVSLLFFAGRLYDLSKVTDVSTGFLSGTPIVSKVLMIILILIVAVCCTLFAHPKFTKAKKVKSQHPGIFGAFGGALFIAAAVFNIINTFKWGGFLGFDIAIILGALSLIVFSFIDIRGEKFETVPFILTTIAFAAVCLNSVIFEISTIHNTIYVFKNIAFITCFVFILLVFKSVYSPSSYTKSALYFISLLNFVFSGLCMLALVIVNVKKIGFEPRYIFLYGGYISMGVYSLTVAFSLTKRNKSRRKEYKVADTVYDTKQPETEVTDDATAYIPAVEKAEEKPRENPETKSEITDTREIRKAEITALFSEKPQENQTEPEEKKPEKKSLFSKSVKEEKPAERQTAVKEDTPVVREKSVRQASKATSDGKTVFKADRAATKSSTGKKVVYKADK